ncbi:uncharacterized protein V1513DRAFT_406253 [Lipomyces chichibuensis]|uniref:uncharacterized protein n=1 Tax=Lipomyces chichibuensis TaxID=1546026 RepID=UPI003342E815
MPFPGEQHQDKYTGAYASQQRRDSLWTDREIAVLQAKLDRQLGPEYISSRPSPGGGTAYYLEGWKAINLANEVFGFNGWSSEIKSIHEDYVEVKDNGKIDVGISVVVRVTLRDGTFHEDIGFGHVENARSKYMALSKCKKEATTDATKRALRCFGNSVGNCLHDNTYRRYVLRMSIPAGRFDATNLHRSPEISAILDQQKRISADHATEEQTKGVSALRNEVRQEPTSGAQQRQEQDQLTSAPQNFDRVASSTRFATHASALETNDRYICGEFDTISRKNSLDEMSFGSDLIEEYNEFDEYMIQSDDLDDFEVAALDGEFVVRPANSGGLKSHTQQQPHQHQSSRLQGASNSNGNLANSLRRPERNNSVVTQTPENTNINVKSNSTPDEQFESTTLHGTAATVSQEVDDDNPPGDVQGQSATNRLATPTTEKSVTFFSARVAEAVQNDQPLDDKALFDVSFQSPSIRKTVDHSVSRPIARSSVTPKVNYDNPRLNTNRMVGLPPSAVNGGRHLLSMGSNCSNGFKRPITIMNDSETRNLEPLRECTENFLNANGSGTDTSREDSSKRLKV